jgi:hypothetical protein
MKIKIYRTIYACFFVGVELGLSRSLRVFENRELINAFRRKRNEITGKGMWQVWAQKEVHSGSWW